MFSNMRHLKIITVALVALQTNQFIIERGHGGLSSTEAPLAF